MSYMKPLCSCSISLCIVCVNTHHLFKSSMGSKESPCYIDMPHLKKFFYALLTYYGLDVLKKANLTGIRYLISLGKGKEMNFFSVFNGGEKRLVQNFSFHILFTTLGVFNFAFLLCIGCLWKTISSYLFSFISYPREMIYIEPPFPLLGVWYTKKIQ